jgi:hypothetical protein
VVPHYAWAWLIVLSPFRAKNVGTKPLGTSTSTPSWDLGRPENLGDNFPAAI